MATRASMFTDAQNFDTHGGVFNSVARDLHVHNYIHTDHGGDHHQLQAVSMSSPILPGAQFADLENANEERVDASGLLLPVTVSYLQFAGH